MYNKAIEVLKIFESHGYLAYIVGGYVRDKILGMESHDIDICTNAKPKEIVELFDTENVSDVNYGSVRVIYKNCIFDVTTFRKDIKYEKNRKPIKIKYVNDLKRDLLRRDFTVNTICISSNGEVIDMLNAKRDLDDHLIKTVGNPRYRLKEDSLRLLRAIRFVGVLGFDIDEKTKSYIKKYGYLLKKLSSYRKREELDKILTSKNKEKCRDLILELGLAKHLGLNNLRDIVLCDDIIGVWSQIDATVDYPFSKLETDTIKKVRSMLKEDINKYSVYKYGLYISSVVGSITGVSYRKINSIYKHLAITNRNEINVKGDDIIKLLNKKPGNYVSKILDEIEKMIVIGELKNEKKVILEYIKEHY